MKLLYINHTAQLSGGELALLNLLQHLDRTKFDPHVLLFADGPLAEALRKEHIPVHVLELNAAINKATRIAAGKVGAFSPGRVLQIAAFIWRLRGAIRHHRPDIVHTNSLKADLLGGLAARLAGIPVVWHIHDRIASDYLPGRMVWLLRRLSRHVPKAVIANSQSTLETLYLPTSKPKIIAYPGIPDPMAGRLPFPEQPSARQPRTVSGATVILVGRISPWKGQDVFIRAAAIVNRTRPDVHFNIVGSVLFGEEAYETEIRQLVQKLGLEKVISFLGFRKDVPDLISKADLLVHASTSPEPFGQVVVQAMAAGKPVVATRGGGVVEIVAEYETGLLVPMGDADAMAAAILMILANPGQAAAMGTAGRQRYLKHFTIDTTVSEIKKVYQRMRDDRNGPGIRRGTGRLHLLFLNHTAALGGGEYALLNLARRLDQNLYQITIILFSDGPLADELRKAGLKVRIVTLSPAINKLNRYELGKFSLELRKIVELARFVRFLTRTIREIQPDIVHTNSLKSDILGGAAARLAGHKLVWHIRDRIEAGYLPKKAAGAFSKLAKRAPHFVIANSHSTLATLNLPKSKPSAVVYSGLPDPQLAPWSPAPVPAVAEQPAGTGGKVVMVGRISPWKGQEVFIRAASLVHQARPEARFEIIGSALFDEDAYAAHIRGLVDSLGLREVVSFLGFRNDVPELIDAADLLVHASTTPEPFGQVVVQAMAAGKPVVATRGGGVVEIVAEYETGLLVPMGDADAMAGAILMILANPGQAAAMGTAGRRRFLEHFTIQTTIDSIQTLYESIAAH